MSDNAASLSADLRQHSFHRRLRLCQNPARYGSRYCTWQLIEFSKQLMKKHELDFLQALYNRTEKPMSRRSWLRAAGLGFGSIGMMALLAEEAKADAAQQPVNPLAPHTPHFEAKAKRVIFLFMHGGPSSIDTFDPKERLYRDHGKPLPIKRPLAFADGKMGPLMKPLWDFKPGGKSGIPISDLFPHVRDCADDLTVIRSMVGEGVDHGAALLQTFTGTSIGFAGAIRA